MTIRSAAAVTFAASSSNLPCSGIAFVIRPPRTLMINSSPLGPWAIWFATAPVSDTSFSNCSTFDMGRSSPIIGRRDRVSTSGHYFRRVKAVVLPVRLKAKIRVVLTSDDALRDHILDPILDFPYPGTVVFSVLDCLPNSQPSAGSHRRSSCRGWCNARLCPRRFCAGHEEIDRVLNTRLLTYAGVPSSVAIWERRKVLR